MYWRKIFCTCALSLVILTSCHKYDGPIITKYFVIYYENHVDTIQVTGSRIDTIIKGFFSEIRRYPRSVDSCCKQYDVIIVTRGEIREINKQDIWPE